KATAEQIIAEGGEDARYFRRRSVLPPRGSMNDCRTHHLGHPHRWLRYACRYRRPSRFVRVVPAEFISTNGLNDLIIGHLLFSTWRRFCLGHALLLSSEFL